MHDTDIKSYAEQDLETIPKGAEYKDLPTIGDHHTRYSTLRADLAAAVARAEAAEKAERARIVAWSRGLNVFHGDAPRRTLRADLAAAVARAEAAEADERARIVALIDAHLSDLVTARCANERDGSPHWTRTIQNVIDSVAVLRGRILTPPREGE